jgi:hypothetical protein
VVVAATGGTAAIGIPPIIAEFEPKIGLKSSQFARY